MNTHLVLVRHSLPEIREDLPACEWHLSAEGRRRAVRLAGQLIPYRPEIIFTSPEPKAKETAEILAGKLQLPLQVVDDLHEHERRSVPHLSKHDFEAVVREFFERPAALVFGDETADQAHERFSRAIHSIVVKNDKSKIVIVAHGTVISLFVSHLTGQPGFQFWSRVGVPSFIVLDLQSKKHIALENIS